MLRVRGVLVGRPTRRTGWAFGLCFSIVLLTGCSGEDDSRFEDGVDSPAQEVIDEAGSYGKLRLGSSRRDVVAARGPGGPRAPELFESGPTEVSFPSEAVEQQALVYKDVMFLLFDGAVAAIYVVRPGAATIRGIALGDSISEVGDAYPGFTCGTANEGTEYLTFPYCEGSVRRGSTIWFGNDPIDVIAIYRNFDK